MSGGHKSTLLGQSGDILFAQWTGFTPCSSTSSWMGRRKLLSAVGPRLGRVQQPGHDTCSSGWTGGGSPRGFWARKGRPDPRERIPRPLTRW
eukprot:4578389-Amphidinium_carterae.1